MQVFDISIGKLMLKTVRFTSRTAFENHLDLHATRVSIAISITDPSAKPARAPRGLTGLIRLSFEDDYEEGLGVEVGSLPDLHERHGDGVRLFFDDSELCDAGDARKIFRFLQQYATREDEVDLVVHCNAGISRSAAVAQFANSYFGCPIVQENPDTSRANRRLQRLLQAHAAGKTPSTGLLARECTAYHAETPMRVIIDGVSSLVPVTPPSTQQIMMMGVSW